MSIEMQLKGKWQQAKGRIKKAWGELTDDELEKAEGDFDHLVGVIREKTGETTEAIEDKLNEILESVSDGGPSDNTTG